MFHTRLGAMIGARRGCGLPALVLLAAALIAQALMPVVHAWHLDHAENGRDGQRAAHAAHHGTKSTCSGHHHGRPADGAPDGPADKPGHGHDESTCPTCQAMSVVRYAAGGPPALVEAIDRPWPAMVLMPRAWPLADGAECGVRQTRGPPA